MIQVSVIVPVYNVKNYLAKCLDSLLNQNHQDFEIIAVNDGSTDGSLEILNAYQAKHPNIVVLSKENGGLSDARNHGIEHAKGEYLCFVDSDDTVEPTYLSSMFGAISKTGADIAVCDMDYVYEDGATAFSSGGVFDLANATDWPDLIAINNSACNKLFARELFDNTRFIKGIWYEDLATIPVVLAKAKCVAKVDQVLYHYLQRNASIVHTQNRKIFDIYRALEAVRDQLTQMNRIDTFKTQLNRMYVKQAVDMTNLRIKDYDAARIEFLTENHQRIEDHYPAWYFNAYVWSNGFKKWVAFTLFKLGCFDWLLSLYR